MKRVASIIFCCVALAPPIPRLWKVIQTVREKFSCRDCETITQPPAPFHVTPRGFAGPQLLAMILFEKFDHTSR